MCGRYALNASLDDIYKAFGVKSSPKVPPQGPISPFNIGPMMNVPIIIDSKLGQALWRYLPSWSKSDEMGVKLKNARSETITEKPMFKDNWGRGKRCAIPMNGFYEWQTQGKEKQPFFVTTSADHEEILSKKPLFFAAGLYDVWQGQIGFTILTKNARPELQHIHHREPVLFEAEQYDEWNTASPEQALGLIQSNTAKDIKFWHVSKQVGNIKKNDPALIKPGQEQGKLVLL
jgi:putative SOS response-associated peptidase YedK